MYASTNFKTKKALKEAVADGKKIYVKSAGPFPAPEGPCSTWLDGPWSPAAHTWHAEVQINADGWIVKVS